MCLKTGINTVSFFHAFQAVFLVFQSNGNPGTRAPRA